MYLIDDTEYLGIRAEAGDGEVVAVCMKETGDGLVVYFSQRIMASAERSHGDRL